MSPRSFTYLTIILLHLSVVAGERSAFIFSRDFKPNPSLHDRTEAQVGVTLDVRLIVEGDSDKDSAMALTGLRFQLNKDEIESEETHPPMPGANGPHPQNSGGVRSLSIIEQPYFVSIEGLQRVDLLQGCWEMVWRDDMPAGSIVCGFNVPTEARRNTYAASLPAGRLYLTLPLFTVNGLEEARARKQVVETKAESLLQERDDELALMKNTNNVLKKALHYRNAFAATEKYLKTGHRKMVDFPLEDVLPVGDGLFMCKKGTIWTKDGSFRSGEHDLLGYATLIDGDL